MSKTKANPLNGLVQAIQAVEGQALNVANKVKVQAPGSLSSSNTKIWASPVTKARMKLTFLKGSHTYLYGPTGTGKSTLAKAVAETMGQGYVRLQAHEGFGVEDWYGAPFVNEKGGMEVAFSVVVEALEEGKILILEEVNSILPENLFPAFSFLDNSESVTVTISGKSKVVKRHPGFRCIATANDNGSGDQNHIYKGGQDMNAAIASRFEDFIHVGYLPVEEEIDMIMEKTGLVDKTFVKCMVSIAQQTRKIAEDEPDRATLAISPRNMLSWAESYVTLVRTQKEHPELTKHLNHTHLVEMSITNRLPDNCQDSIKEMVTNELSRYPIKNLRVS